ncbi:MAG: endolytic transglycosylase MltG [Halioglobus sp.]
MRRLLLALFLLGTMLAVAASFFVHQQWQRPLQIPDEGYYLEVSAGERFRSVVERLAGAGVVPAPYLLMAYGRWTGLDEKIKRGEYLILPGIDPVQLLGLLTTGVVIQYQVTLPEGITLGEAIAMLGADTVLRQSVSGPEDEQIKALLPQHENLEGLFFPDSYSFEKGATDIQVLQRAMHRMEKVLAEEWAVREDGLPYETPYKALVMASIIERETGQASERQQIAGVFVRRLQKGMRLQTDPTVIYGLGEEFDGNLRRSHLRDSANPYNTYRHRGLPPTPIALPGRAAIHAALHPDDSKSLYFVARGDGSHIFSETLKEHQAAVREFQHRRVKNYRSSPEN